MELEFRHLRVVRAIADNGTLTAAAAELGMTQPSVTEALRRAERATGAPLFQRDAHGAVPTPLGEVVTAHARTVLTAMDRLDAATARHHSGTLPPSVRFGCTPSLLVANLTVAVPQVMGIGVEVRTGIDPAVQLSLLADRRVEAALVVGNLGPRPADGSGIECAVVAVEPLFVSVAAGHRLAGASEIDLCELADEVWCVADGPRSEGVEHLRQGCQRAGFTPRIRQADYTTAFQLCELAQAVLPMMPGSRRRTGQTLVPLRDSPLRQRTCLFWHADGPLPRSLVERLWKELVEAQHGIIEQTPVYQAWLVRHPRWGTTPPEMVAEYAPGA
ncbi:LysR family transcriptional regulator [Streptomyces zagrosensis]|uniref:DNA-binding transcriptional LysR family regulator n=1 Tax=Streptomyces zagrosensis TaxID=1042984 RepID=A0A7W9Q939_9ACTN|nr:LysR family transcriptional regulator [Streptomyces zagrosensis]MBB5935869.1 DNA-binding transcriptional LysR family regulator [Streptomyces zagrosensis]